MDDIWDQSSDTQPTQAYSAAELVTVTRVYQFGVAASKVIDHLTKLTFAPLIQTDYYDALGSQVDSFRLTLNQPMMSLTSVTLADDTSLTVGTDIRGWPRTGGPILELRVLDSGITLRTTSGTLDDDITVVGVWGWHNDYANGAWIASGDAINTTALTTTVTTVKVTDAAGVGGDGISPRFSPGNMIQIDSEWMAVTATDSDSSPNTLTVVRGVRGSTAATHDVDTAISVFKPEGAIMRACQMIANFNYSRRGQTDRVVFDTSRTTGLNMDIPPEAMDILDMYQFLEIGS
jgi:hypothetical protein